MQGSLPLSDFRSNKSAFDAAGKDSGLFGFSSLWAAAGHAHAVFNLTPAQLQAMTGAPTVAVSAAVLANQVFLQ